MPRFFLQGNEISINNANCDVEIVSNNTSISHNNGIFFKNNGTGIGRIELTNVSNLGYHLVAPDSNTSLSELNNDVFNGKLKINNVQQKYCAKGLAPLGRSLVKYTNTSSSNLTYYFYRYSDGSCNVKTSDGTVLNTLSTASENKRVYTFVLSGGGGGGCQGGTGFGWWSGGGGGGGGAVIVTFYFLKNITTDIQFTLTIGYGGNGGNWGSPGSATKISIGTTDLAVANAGNGGGRDGSGLNGGYGGTASVGTSTDVTRYRILNSITASGADGGHESNAGGSTPQVQVYNYTVNSNHISSIGNKSGGAKEGGSSDSGGAGGGGASLFANGNTVSDGAGGHGSEGNFFSTAAGQNGGPGFIEIFY